MYDKTRGQYGGAKPGAFQKGRPDYNQQPEPPDELAVRPQKSDTFYVDIHCHSSFQSYNQTNKTTIKEVWPASTKKSEIDKHRFNDTPSFLQSDFTTLSRSRVRVVFNALLPLEQGFLWYRAKWMARKFADWLMKIPPERSKEVQHEDHDYFEDLEIEYNLVANEEYWKCPEYISTPNGLSSNTEIKVVSSYKDLTETLHKEKYTTAVVLTIEGGHALGGGALKWLKKIENKLLNQIEAGYTPIEDIMIDDEDDSFSNPRLDCKMVARFKSANVRDLTLQLLTNIKKIKSWEGGKFAPLFLTFSHHFWNQLCGHAISLPFLKGKVKFLNQEMGIELPMTEVGKVVLCALLSKKNGKRILIDTKHMSIAGKKWYYKCLERYNDEHEEDKIPIISSHSAASTSSNMKNSYYSTESANALYEKSKNRFNIWDINLSDEEIIRIYKSDGLIGINFDERILAGKVWRNQFCKKYLNLGHLNLVTTKDICQFRSEWAGSIASKIRQWERFDYEWASIIAEQIYYFAKLIADEEGIICAQVWNDDDDQSAKKPWRILALGSDFDGAINPTDAYCSTVDFSKLENALISNFIDMRDGNTNGDISAQFRLKSYPLLHKLTDANIEQIVSWFMRDNAMRFLEKYFTDEYRSLDGASTEAQ